ncbi:hypothetical protein [Lignipirellula cremea]|uniref:DUF5666 domain-containing protein n=1 Tax=Lignipirellula cremea TaxID=2528010 RepID=A0A518DYB0_9BACT|nr:hypothetical protein [Lignipirellula cremea]QDU96836.1 hypothetical protein Pla8534_46580 [Lignipirellula cremea]
MRPILLLSLLALVTVPTVVTAQNPYGRRPSAAPVGQEKPSVRWKGEGEYVGRQGNVIAVKTEEGDQWLALLPENKQGVSLVGPADRNFLQRGMLVKFRAVFNASGVLLSALDEITIITPREDDQIGVKPEGAPIGGEPLFGETKAKVATVTCTVVGRLGRIAGDQITIAAGRSNIVAELSPKAAIRVDVADVSAAQPGDKVRLEGMHYPGREGQLFASTILITAANPLGSKPEKPESPAAEKTEPAGQQ